MPSFSVIIQKSRVVFQLSGRERLWVVILFLFSGVIRACVLWLPFIHTSRFLGHCYQYSFSTVVQAPQQAVANNIGLISSKVAKYTPWESACLVQAMMAISLLRYYKIPYVLYLGVTKASSDAADSENVNSLLRAHAWLTVGDRVITGRHGYKAYTIVATFIYPASLAAASSNDDQ